MLLSMLVKIPCAGSEADGGAGHLTVQSTIKDILGHPSFAGFGRLMFPLDDRAYDENLPLTRIASLLPYHTHVDPEAVANALNRMIDDAASGRKVNRDIHVR